ncbi:hypothetical protein Cfor_10238 [Coptotermes formosanus]|uniref:Gustatory receptor n=1 Tax=Coptotermes formosanus TaxID=36987 RepID=A0A6L2PHJ0_COPFO|nr:hypothetical protein Cfor_10238 [Coptotermes formosanus]
MYLCVCQYTQDIGILKERTACCATLYKVKSCQSYIRSTINSMDIFYALKPLYFLSKFVGLISFSLHFDSRTGKHIIQSTGVLNFVQNVYTFVIFCGITAGFVMCVRHVHTKLSTNPAQVVRDMFSAPANFITSMTCIVMMTVINRKEMIKLVTKLRTIDDILLEGKGFKIYLKTRRRMLTELVVIFGVLVPFLCYDSYFFGQLSSSAYEAMSRVSIAVNLTTVLQFLWTMRFFRHRLWLLNQKVLDSFCLQSDSLRKHTYASCSDRWRRFFQQPFTGLEEGLCSNKICSVFREGNIRKLSVLPISDIKQNDLRTLQQQSTSSDTVSCILNLRVTYNHIYEGTLIANSIYGISIIFTLMYCFVSTVSHTYFTFIDNFTNFDELEKKMPNVGYYIATHIIWIVISVGKTVAISGSCHMVKEESKILVNNLQKLQLRHPIRPDVLLHLQQFSTQVSQNTIHFSAFGFFSVNLSLLYAFIASSVTYVIILIQFRLN